MKKFSTLIVALLAATSMSAKTEITLGTWTPWGATASVSGNTLTMSEAWAGAGNWLANGTECADWSDGDYLELDLSNCTGSFSVAIEYNDGKTVDDKGNPTKVDALTTKGGIASGDQVAFIKLNQDYCDKVVNLWLQSAAANISVTVDKAYLITEDEYKDYLDQKSKGEQVAWEGNFDFGTGWSTNMNIDASKFATAQSGATFTFTYTVGSENYAQIKICDSSWKALASPKGQNEWNCVPLDMSGTSYSTVLSDDDLATVKAGGMVLQGFNATLTKVSVSNSTTAGINSIQAGKEVRTGATYNLAGQRVGKTFHGMVIRDGKKFVQE